MKRDGPLNERQARVLRWVSDGCPECVLTDHGHKSTAVALQDRGLVTVSRKGGVWRATLTAAGGRRLTEETDVGPPERPAAADGADHGDDLSGRDASEDEVVVPDVREHDVSPADQRPSVLTPSLARRSVPVPAQLRGPLPVVQALRQAAAGHKPGADGRLDLRHGDVLPVQVSRAALPRLLRVLQAVAREAESRGAPVQVRPTTSRRGTPGLARCVLVRGDDEVALLVSEETDRVPRVPGPAEVARARREPWWKPPAYDHRPSGRLRLRLDAPNLTRSLFADGARRRLEDQLGEFFDAVEQALDREVALRLDRQRREDERRRQADLARAEAHAAARHERLAGTARQQATDWCAAQGLRRYADALRAAAADEDAVAWADWVRVHADETDPLTRPVGHPPDREPTWTELARHLPGGHY